MKTTTMLLRTVASAALLAPAPVFAATTPAVVTNLTGSLQIHQEIPCGSVNRTTAVSGGRIELTPASGVDVSGGKLFSATSATILFAPFSIGGSCFGFGSTRHYTELGIQLPRPVNLQAVAAGGGVYTFTIPKDQFQVYEAARFDGNIEQGLKRPSEDVTGTIDLANGTLQLHAVFATSIHFREGCVPVLGCAIDETDPGTLTADVSGTIAFPDTDHDGVGDDVDNCKFTANADQSPVATPVVTAPPNLTVASCLDHSIGAATGQDVCDRTAVSLTNNAPAVFALGANTVTWTGLDGMSRSGTAAQVVTVVDQTKPTFTSVPLDITVNTCGPVSLLSPAATDDCAGTPVITNNAPPYFYIGTTPVVWTATDVSGNAATATQNVTVIDTTPPVVSCAAAAPQGNSFVATATDACDTPIIRLGAFVIANGEQIKIEETGKPGVRFIDRVGPNQIRHFHVAKGQAVITATDASGNVASATCR